MGRIFQTSPRNKTLSGSPLKTSWLERQTCSSSLCPIAWTLRTPSTSLTTKVKRKVIWRSSLSPVTTRGSLLMRRLLLTIHMSFWTNPITLRYLHVLLNGCKVWERWFFLSFSQTEYCQLKLLTLLEKGKTVDKQKVCFPSYIHPSIYKRFFKNFNLLSTVLLVHSKNLKINYVFLSVGSWRLRMQTSTSPDSLKVLWWNTR